MPLLGKIVVIKRQGGDGTEFPLTASCLFGRKIDCDIRIQLPQVSKEHCKIELNENKELILTNLSSVNPTRINGQVLNQSERLKHGDLITIIDRSFRFEYPPPKTPKKRLSTAGKDKAVKTLQDQQEKSTPIHTEKRKSEHSFDTCLKDGSNLPTSVDQSVETESEDGKIKKDSMSPFCELYQMFKQELAVKSPWKSDMPKTPARIQVDNVGAPAADAITGPAVPKSSCNVSQEENHTGEMLSLGSITPSLTEKSVTPVSQKKRTPLKTPQKFSAGEVVQQVLLEPQPEVITPKSPKGRRSGASLTLQTPLDQPQTPAPMGKNTEVKMSPRTSPRSNAGKRFHVQDVQHEMEASTSKDKDGSSVNEVCDGNKATVSKAKRKRVSFGGQLSPELFDKRLPPDSPLCRGATPRHSLGPSQKSQSLLRRASTIGLMALRLKETVPESSTKKASPKQAGAKTPSPARRSPSTKAKTPSPKPQKSPSASPKAPKTSSTPATPKTPSSARRASTSAVDAAGDTCTPRVQGRFSISRIKTPSPVQDQEENSEVQPIVVEDMPQKCVTPKIPLRRKSMKSSARKTPKSTIKSAFDVIRSRRSGASRANLKVLTSWADIVKFGQPVPQTDVTTKKKPTKSKVVKRTAVPKPKTPARRLKDEVSTGHAASPVSIVVGKAHVRTNQFCGAAPKIVNNMALYKKDMKMDEDFTGVADIFKTPANRKSKNVVPIIECPEMLVDEISVMKTPEESGEMIISPLSVRSTAKSGSYNSEAVTRLLLDDQDAVLSQLTDSSNEASGLDIVPDQEIPSNDQTEEEEEETEVKTPKWKASPSLYLTGVKRLMKTPKQRAEPIEDLRGKLLKTPKAYKPPQEDNLEGIKELLKTPNYKGAPVEDIVEEKTVMQTPKEKSLPVLCPASNQKLMETPKEKSEQHEELLKTPKLKGDQEENQFCLKKSVKTPKQKRIQVEEDLTGVQQLMKTPKHKGEPVQDQMGIKRLMQTPKEKVEPVEYLTGVKRLMQTPKQKRESFSNEFGIGKLMMTPQHEGVMTEAAIAGFKELEEPENNCTLTTENGLTEPSEIQGPVPEVESDSALLPAKDFEECDKENDKETMEAEVDSQSITEIIDSIHSDVETDVVIPQEKNPDQIEESASVEDVDVCFSETNDKSEEQSNESTSHNSIATVEATLISSTAEKEEEQIIKSSLANRIQRGGRGRATQKSKNADNEKVNIPAALSITEEEKMNDPLPSNPVRGRRAKKLLEAPEVAASPARKSARSKIPNYRFVDKEEKNSEASQVPVDSVKTEMPTSLPVVTKTRRGRKAKQDDAKAAIEPVDDTSVCDPQCIDALANEELGQRQKMDKKGSLPSEKLEQKTSDVVCEENAVAPEGVKLLASLVTETVTATRPRRGIPAKNEQLKTEPTPTMENEITSTHAAVVAEKSLTHVAKSGRGRKAKKEIVKEQPCVAEVNVDEDEPETLVVKSGRGRKAKQQKPQIAEEVVDQPAEDASTCLSVTEEHTETVVKSVRGSRKTKQSKETVSIETEKNIVSLVEKSETPVVKAGRKRAVIAKETVVETEVSVKRGRRAVADPVPPVPVVSSRGRKVVAKAKVTEDIDSSEQPSEPIKQTRRTAKVPETKREENPMTHAGSEVVAAENTAIVVAEKVGRGSRGRKQKDSSKDIPNNPINEFSKAEKASEINPSKTVNWNPDLVTSKDIEEFEPSADVEPLKKSRRLGKVPAKTSSNQSTDLPPRGRRGAKKEEEPLIEEVQINIKPLRRGKPVGSAAPKSDPSDSKASAPLKRKHNDVLEVTDESPKKEPLPKKRGRVAISTKVAAEVSSKEKTPVTEPEKGEDNAKKTGNRAVRGQKKTTQEPDPAPTQESVSGTTTRRGRSVKKVEEVEISTEAAPVRRTRRK